MGDVFWLVPRETFFIAEKTIFINRSNEGKPGFHEPLNFVKQQRAAVFENVNLVLKTFHG